MRYYWSIADTIGVAARLEGASQLSEAGREPRDQSPSQDVYAEDDESSRLPVPGSRRKKSYILDALAAWDLDDFFFLNLHLLREQSVPRSEFNVFFGPGLLFGVEDVRGSSRLAAGVSLAVGTNFFVARFETFVQIAPQLRLLPDLSGVFGGGIGLRYYFG